MHWDWRADLEANSHRRGRSGAIIAFLFDPGFTAVCWIRLLLYLQKKERWLFRLFSSMVFVHIVKAFGCHISAKTASIGKGLKLSHPVGIVIGAGTVIGDDVIILQGGTIGRKNPRSDIDSTVIIGNGVLLSAGAVVVGNIKIGEGATVGANAVVTRDVLPGATVVGGRFSPKSHPAEST